MKTMHKSLLFVLVLLLALVPTVLGQNGTADTIDDAIAADGRFDTLAAAVEAAGLGGTLSGGQWTLFAPTDAAFAALGLDAEAVAAMSPDELAGLLLYHVLEGDNTSSKLKAMTGDITMANGQLAGLKFFDGDLYINDYVKVIEANHLTGNGTIHVVDHVIQGPWPRVDEGTPSVREALAAIAATVIGDEAPAATEGTAPVAVEMTDTADAAESADMSGEAAAAGTQELQPILPVVPDNSIAGVAVVDGRFDTLIAAAIASGLVDDLAGGTWTAFAPTDAAFAKLGLNADNIAEQFTADELANILLYHVMEGDNSTDKLKAMLGDVTMANGALAGLKYFDGSVWVNDDSRVIEPNIVTDNGTIHVVDTVILPPWPRE